MLLNLPSWVQFFCGKGRIAGNGFLTCPPGTRPVCGKTGDPTFCELKKLGIDSLGRNLVIPKPLDDPAGAANFFVATGLKLSFRGWLSGVVEVCALAEEANPRAATSAAQITLRTIHLLAFLDAILPALIAR
jgi:hypothetical protein